jgi:hypothetical protein
MDERAERISELLHEAGEVHHVVYRITDGADDDWASFYVHALVESERALAETAPGAGWEDFYADRIIDRFG